MDKKLLHILACPVCRGSLEFSSGSMSQPLSATEKTDTDKSETSCSEELICHTCALAFPVRDDIPVMLESEARKEIKSISV